ncbi:hypothetical protein JKP88DRAFT_179845 [Tribonema minus]|uniref:UDP-galactose translocator n=1 Tax=Tribonema minus TaxID=303371 RepID=A0A836CHP3_9STRA|nr:hypothetical protein JKP88DRAFT_179845 [Tribonema minus]
MEVAKSSSGNSELIRQGAMVTLVIQNSALALFMRYSRSAAREGPMYAATTAVVCAEVVKVAMSLLLQTKEDGGVAAMARTLHRDIFTQPVEMLKMSIPACLYCLQNNLAYVAVSHLDGPTYQLLYQLKILTTAMFSVAMLKKALGVHQWVSLFLLALGVGMVQLSGSSGGGGGGSAAAAAGPAAAAAVVTTHQNSLVGLVAVIAACMTSGFAGVYFEKVLKTSKVSIWVRNIQLAGYGMFIGLGGVYMGPEGASVMERGFLYGYTWAVWVAVLLNSLGGLIVAVVVKYADNVVKGFATSISILMTCVVSYFLFNFSINAQFLAGAVTVLYATYLYGQARGPALPRPLVRLLCCCCRKRAAGAGGDLDRLLPLFDGNGKAKEQEASSA